MNDKKMILDAYNLLSEGKKLSEIANILGVNELKLLIGLTKEFEYYIKEDPINFTENMLNDIRASLKLGEEDGFDISNLDKMYKSEEKKIKFMGKCILCFGLRTNAILEVFGMDADVFLKKLDMYDWNLKIFINKLFQFGSKNQDIAKKEFKKYFVLLTELYNKKDTEKIKEHLSFLTNVDKDAMRFKLSHKYGMKISEEELIAILKYQLKYCLSSYEVSTYFAINRSSYVKRLKNLKDIDPELFNEYDDFVANIEMPYFNRGRF